MKKCPELTHPGMYDLVQICGAFRVDTVLAGIGNTLGTIMDIQIRFPD